MVKTFVAVHLIEVGKNIVVPMKFIYTMNRWIAYNRRINRNQVYLLFYSQDYNKIPNCYLAKRDSFSDTDDGCYYGKLLKCFGKKIQKCMYF